MLFNSLDFLCFFPIVCLLSYVCQEVGMRVGRGAKLRNVFLLCASWYFYANWAPAFLLLLVGEISVGYLAGKLMAAYNGQRKSRLVLILALTVIFGLLAVFKYLDFLSGSVISLLKGIGVYLSMPEFGLLLPVGISFFTFQIVGYLLDCRKDPAAMERDFVDFALYVSFFPQLVAGPIERAGNLIPQFKSVSPLKYSDFSAGARMMVWGYFLKLVLADRCAVYVDAVFDNWPMHNGGSMLLAAFLFVWQIYGDFAGYSFVAIGTARILGFSLMENFRRPLLAVSVSEYWRRWHISLSGWLRDYLYIPLGGSRGGKWHTFRNTIITFMASGLWHGAAFTYLAWGAAHGIQVCLERATGIHKASPKGIVRVAMTLSTFVFLAAAFILFRSRGFDMAIGIFDTIFSRSGLPYFMAADLAAAFTAIIIVFAVEFTTEFRPKFSLGARMKSWLMLSSGSPESYIAITLEGIWLALAICFILLFGVLYGDQFIYFQF